MEESKDIDPVASSLSMGCFFIGIAEASSSGLELSIANFDVTGWGDLSVGVEADTRCRGYSGSHCSIYPAPCCSIR